MSEPVDHHGHSPAAWTAVIAMLVGITLLTISLFIEWDAGIWVGVILTVIGVPLGWILAKAGFGVNGPRYQPKSRGH